MKTTYSLSNKLYSQKGSAMIEALIAFVVLMVGLLGLVGLQTFIQSSNIEAYQRTQALVILNDMKEKIALNKAAAVNGNCFHFSVTAAAPEFVGYDAANGGLDNAALAGRCDATGVSAIDAASDDALIDWSNLLLGNGEVDLSGNPIGGLTGARGCISYSDVTRTVTVAVAWQGMSETFVPPSTLPDGVTSPVALNCGTGLYGVETKRRMVYATVQIPELK